MDEEAIIQRALDAHRRACTRAAVIYMQPARKSCRVAQVDGTWYVMLANGVGGADDILAVYELVGNPWRNYRLVGKKEWPAELGDW